MEGNGEADHLNPDYRAARFRADPPLDGWPAQFGIVTACNPHGRIQEDSANRDATDELARELRCRNLAAFPVTGGSADFSHAEFGFGVVGASLDDILSLGQIHRQDAVFWVDAGTVWLVRCTDGRRECLGPWDQLWLGSLGPP